MIDNVNYARATKVNFKGGDPSNSDNYEKVASGMSEDTYLNYMHITFRGFLQTTLDNSATYLVENLIKNNGSIAGGRSDGTKFQFSWGNNSTWGTGDVTEYVYPPKFEEGYLHRKNDMARVRCVRKQ